MDQFELKNGQVFVLVEAAGGIYSADALATICKLAETHSAFLKVTEDQRIGFMIPSDAQDEIGAALQAEGLLLRPYQRAGVPAPKACLGELCPHSEQDALADAIDLQAELSGRYDATRPFVSLGINGCFRACVGSAIDDFHIVGDESGYKVSLGGKAREIPALGQFVTDNVPREKLTEVVTALLDVFYEHVASDERLVDVIERMGLSAFTQATEHVLHGHSPAEDTPESELDGDALPQGELSEDVMIEGDDVALSESASAFESHDDQEPVIDDEALTAEEGELLTSEMGDGGELDASETVEPSLDSEATPTFEDVPLEDIEEIEEIEDKVEDDDVLLEDDSLEPAPQSPAPLEEELDIDDETPQPRAPWSEATPPSPKFTSVSADAQEDLLEEGGLDIAEASADDLARVTNAIRAEVTDDHADLSGASPGAPPSGFEPASTDVNSEILAFEKTRTQPQGKPPKTGATPRSNTGLSVRIDGGMVSLALPGGFQFRCPVEGLFEGESALLDVQTEHGPLTVVSKNGVLTVCVGSLELSLPLQARRAA
ncbi:MAG: hypothetical protein IOD12_03565 [Silvanigrellales bacterium]|nr:hypothetical protein [Silvanigrellales bacterium]